MDGRDAGQRPGSQRPIHGTDVHNSLTAAGPPRRLVSPHKWTPPLQRRYSQTAAYRRAVTTGSNNTQAASRTFPDFTPPCASRALLRDPHSRPAPIYHTAPSRLGRESQFAIRRPPVWTLYPSITPPTNRVSPVRCRSGAFQVWGNQHPSAPAPLPFWNHTPPSFANATGVAGFGGSYYRPDSYYPVPGLHIDPCDEQPTQPNHFSAGFASSSQHPNTFGGPSVPVPSSAPGTDSWDAAFPFDSNDMAAVFSMQSGDARRHASASHRNSRFENQRPMSNQLCRNGPQCRKYQEGTGP